MNIAKRSTQLLRSNVRSKQQKPTQNPITQHQNLVILLNSCKHTFEISRVHGFMVKTGFDHDSFITSKLLASSIKDIQYATSIFNSIKNPNLFMYNTILRAYSCSDDPKSAFLIFSNLRTQSLVLDQFSFVTTLKVCTRKMDLWTGQTIHGLVLKYGFVVFINVKNTIMHLYCVCERISEAQKLFDEMSQSNDLVSWNTLMGGYLQVSKPNICVELFRQMFRCGFAVSDSTLLSLLSALGALGDSLGGKLIHGYCIKIGLLSFTNVVTALIEMYAETGDIDSGCTVFNGAVNKDIVMWNCMIGMYAKAGLKEEALALLKLVKLDKLKPNSSTLVGLITACDTIGSMRIGEYILSYAEEERIELDAVLGTALIDMFAKCGALEKAVNIFQRMQSKDVKTWSAMILAYGLHGRAEEAVKLFHRMENEGFVPNEVTFLAILNSCSHGGLVKEAIDCFERMVRVYDFSPRVEHYGCVIDLLARAGLLQEAYNLIKGLPIKADAIAWRALLAACRVYGNVKLGECVKRVLNELDSEHPTDAALFSGMYAIAGRLPDYTRWNQPIEEKRNTESGNKPIMEKTRLAKEAGCSATEMDILYTLPNLEPCT